MGGNLRKSAHFDETDAVMGCRDIVILSNVKEAGSAVSEQAESTVKDHGDCVEKEEARTTRKKTKKREREEENDNKDRKMFRAVLGLGNPAKGYEHCCELFLTNTRETAYNDECLGGDTR